MNKVVSNMKKVAIQGNWAQLNSKRKIKKQKSKATLKAIEGTLLCKRLAAIFKLCVVELRTNTS